MTSRTVNLEETKKKFYRRLAVELGEQQPADDEQPESEKPFILVTFEEKRPSYVLPILGILQEHAQGIATVSHNLGKRR